jgi:dimethylargininase
MRARPATFAAPVRALVRAVPARYVDCLRSDRSRAIDLEAARRQHASYVDALRALAIEVVVLPPADDLPDACFVEDAAVALDRHALLTCPGAPARRAEVASVGAALEAHRALRTMTLDVRGGEGVAATLDGGDVLRAGSVLFVGLSTRTTPSGVEALREVAALDGLTVEALEVRGGLHLKSACTLASARVVLIDPAILDGVAVRAFERAGLSCVDALEPVGANVLALGEAVLASAAAPRTVQRLVALDLSVCVVDVGELHAGDGALTCLSIRLAAAGTWCA